MSAAVGSSAWWHFYKEGSALRKANPRAAARCYVKSVAGGWATIVTGIHNPGMTLSDEPVIARFVVREEYLSR